jgi:putative N6-adenine-specific DNA methylase
MKLDYGAVEFQGKLMDAWKINAFSRTTTRVLIRIVRFSAENFGKYEKELSKIPWELYLPSATGVLPEISVTTHTSRLYHSDALLERAQPIIAKALHKNSVSFSVEPPVESTQTIFLRFENDICQVSAAYGKSAIQRGLDRLWNVLPSGIPWQVPSLCGGIFSRLYCLFPWLAAALFPGSCSWSKGFCPAKKGKSKRDGYALGKQPAFKKPHGSSREQQRFPPSSAWYLLMVI